jgi:hypothetical protein
LISNYHVVKGAANDLALLKVDGIPRGGTPLSIAASRAVHQGVRTILVRNLGLKLASS